MELAGYRIDGSVRVDEYDGTCIRHILLHREQCAKHDMNLDQGAIAERDKIFKRETHVVVL
jgi:hypothetical protein